VVPGYRFGAAADRYFRYRGRGGDDVRTAPTRGRQKLRVGGGGGGDGPGATITPQVCFTNFRRATACGMIIVAALNARYRRDGAARLMALMFDIYTRLLPSQNEDDDETETIPEPTDP